VFVGVWYYVGGHLYLSVFLLVCGSVVGVFFIGLCGCWCVLFDLSHMY